MCVKLYSSPLCPKCQVLKNFMEESSISFEVIDTTVDYKAFALLVSKGRMSLPQVSIDGVFIDGDISEMKEILLSR